MILLNASGSMVLPGPWDAMGLEVGLVGQFRQEGFQEAVPPEGLGPGRGGVHAGGQAQQLGRQVVHDLPAIIQGPTADGTGVLRVIEATRTVGATHELTARGGPQQANGPQGIQPVSILQDGTLGIDGGQTAGPGAGPHGIRHPQDLRCVVSRSRQDLRSRGGTAFPALGPVGPILGHKNQVMDQGCGSRQIGIGARLRSQAQGPSIDPEHMLRIVGQFPRGASR